MPVPIHPSSTVEQYVKCIFLVAQYHADKFVPMSAIAKEMSVAPSTATAMMKNLEKEGLIHYTQRKGVTLTAAGEELALCVLRRHRLIETFLAKVLNYNWDEVHEDAERLEHAVSDIFVDKISAYMNYPTQDPHGSPIPSKNGKLDAEEYISLERGDVGETYTIKKIYTRDDAVVSELAKNSLYIGTVISILEKNTQLDSVTLELLNKKHTVSMGSQLASLLFLEIKR